ncbi:MAG: hypothetical protein ABI836_06560 [Gemmatimonadota bacterium]
MLLSTGFAGTLSAQATAGHTHAAPHGGEVVEIAEHHVEFKADSSGAISVWLLDEHQKVMTPPAGGRVTLIPEGGDQVILPLNVDGASQRLVAQFDPTKWKAFQAVVSLAIGGQRHNFRFHYPATHH